MLFRSSNPSRPIRKVLTQHLQFFDLQAAKGYSNIPVNEPNVANAARNAALAASRRPRPTYKFQEPDDKPHGRKLSSGETPVVMVHTPHTQPHALQEQHAAKKVKTNYGQINIAPKPCTPAFANHLPTLHPATPVESAIHQQSAVNDARRVYISQLQQIPLATPAPSFTNYDPIQANNNPFSQHCARKDNALRIPPGSNWQTPRSTGQQHFRPSETPIHPHYSSHMNAYANPNNQSQAQAGDYSSHASASQIQSDWSRAHRNDTYLSSTPTTTNQQHRSEKASENVSRTLAQTALQTGYAKGFAHETTDIQQDRHINDNSANSRGFHQPTEPSLAPNPAHNLVASHNDSGIETGAKAKLGLPHRDLGEQTNQEYRADCGRREDGIRALLNSSSSPHAESECREGTAQHASAAGAAGQLQSENGQQSAMPTISQALRTVPPLHFATTPHGQATWPNSLPSADGENAIPLTPFFNMDSFSTRGRSVNPFAMSSSKNMGFLPLTPRFFGMDPMQSTRSLSQPRALTPASGGESSQQGKDQECQAQSKLSERQI